VMVRSTVIPPSKFDITTYQSAAGNDSHTYQSDVVMQISGCLISVPWELCVALFRFVSQVTAAFRTVSTHHRSGSIEHAPNVSLITGRISARLSMGCTVLQVAPAAWIKSISDAASIAPEVWRRQHDLAEAVLRPCLAPYRRLLLRQYSLYPEELSMPAIGFIAGYENLSLVLSPRQPSCLCFLGDTSSGANSHQHCDSFRLQTEGDGIVHSALVLLVGGLDPYVKPSAFRSNHSSQHSRSYISSLLDPLDILLTVEHTGVLQNRSRPPDLVYDAFLFNRVFLTLPLVRIRAESADVSLLAVALERWLLATKTDRSPSAMNVVTAVDKTPPEAHVPHRSWCTTRRHNVGSFKSWSPLPRSSWQQDIEATPKQVLLPPPNHRWDVHRETITEVVCPAVVLDTSTQETWAHSVVWTYANPCGINQIRVRLHSSERALGPDHFANFGLAAYDDCVGQFVCVLLVKASTSADSVTLLPDQEKNLCTARACTWMLARTDLQTTGTPSPMFSADSVTVTCVSGGLECVDRL